MNGLAVRRPGEGGKPSPVKRELVEATWEEWQTARAKAMKSTRIEDGIAAGHAWGAFLKLFEKT